MTTKKLQIGSHSNSASTHAASRLRNIERTPVAKAISVALLAGIASGPLHAQESALDEITVTATKRAESVMDVPLAITAMSGEFMREANLDDVKDLVAYASRGMTLHPGDVISTGTPPGVGVYRDPKVFIRPGQTIRCEIDSLGTLENRVRGEQE